MPGAKVETAADGLVPALGPAAVAGTVLVRLLFFFPPIPKRRNSLGGADRRGAMRCASVSAVAARRRRAVGIVSSGGDPAAFACSRNRGACRFVLDGRLLPPAGSARRDALRSDSSMVVGLNVVDGVAALLRREPFERVRRRCSRLQILLIFLAKDSSPSALRCHSRGIEATRCGSASCLRHPAQAAAAVP